MEQGTDNRIPLSEYTDTLYFVFHTVDYIYHLITRGYLEIHCNPFLVVSSTYISVSVIYVTPIQGDNTKKETNKRIKNKRKRKKKRPLRSALLPAHPTTHRPLFEPGCTGGLHGPRVPHNPPAHVILTVKSVQYCTPEELQ